MSYYDLTLRLNFIKKYNLSDIDIYYSLFSSNLAVNYILENYDVNDNLYSVSEMLCYLPDEWYTFAKKYSKSSITEHVALEFIDGRFYCEQYILKMKYANKYNLSQNELEELFKEFDNLNYIINNNLTDDEIHMLFGTEDNLNYMKQNNIKSELQAAHEIYNSKNKSK